jgi:hypothetical protein
MTPGVSRRGLLLSAGAAALSAGAPSVSCGSDANQSFETLTDVRLSSDLVPWRGSQGRLIAGFQPIGGQISSAVFAPGADDGGRLQIIGAAELQCGPTEPNFGSTDDPSGLHVRHEAEMTTTIVFNGFLSKTFTLRPLFPEIAPSGGQAGTEVSVDSLDTVRAELNAATTDPRIIRFDPEVSTVLESNSATRVFTVADKENFTVVGHRGVIWGKDACPSLQRGKNARFVNMAFRVGADPEGQPRENRDSFVVRYGENISFEHCDFSWSIDELLSVIRNKWVNGDGPEPNWPYGYPWPKRILFYRCAFYEPLKDSGHSAQEWSHPYGCTMYEGCQQVVFYKCVWFGANMRSPNLATRSTGWLVRNCLVGDWGKWGTAITSNARNVENDNNTQAVIQANLYGYTDIKNTEDHKDRAIAFNRVGSGGRIFIEPAGSQYANHLYLATKAEGSEYAFPAMEPEPYDPQRVFLAKGREDRSSIVATPPFEFEGYPLHPTHTVEQRKALWDELVGPNCLTGVRTFDNGDPLTGNPNPGYSAMSKIGYNAFTAFSRTGFGRRPTGGYREAPPTGDYDLSNDQVAGAYDVGAPP